jgi:hypothetical protein
MYNLIDISQNTNIDQASELVDLFRKLDKYTEAGKPVVIVKDGEIKAGNSLAWSWSRVHDFQIGEGMEYRPYTND